MAKTVSISKEVNKSLILCVNHHLYDGIDGYSYENIGSLEYRGCSYNYSNPSSLKYEMPDYEYNYQNLSYKYRLVEDYNYPIIDMLQNYTYKLVDYHYSY